MISDQMTNPTQADVISQLNEKIKQHPYLSKEELQVMTLGNELFVSGEVINQLQKKQLNELVRQVNLENSAVAVINQVTIKYGIPYRIDYRDNEPLKQDRYSWDYIPKVQLNPKTFIKIKKE